MTDDYTLSGQMTWFDQGFAFGKMFREHSAPTKARTSELCWKSLCTSRNQEFLFLDARNGANQDLSAEIAGALLGGRLMLNTGECPKEERESHLSWILQADAPEKYSLSAKACQGILTRASRRGKELPDVLKRALENVIVQHSSSDIPAQIPVGGCRTSDTGRHECYAGMQPRPDTFLTDRNSQ